MLSKFKVQRYKSLFDVEVDLEPLTVFIGHNGSGKSNICESLAVLSNFLERLIENNSNKNILLFFAKYLNAVSEDHQFLESKFWHGKPDSLLFEVSIPMFIVWKPEEVDMILIVVDADDNLPQRQKDLDRALNKIRDNHLDVNDQPINDRSTGGLAIRNFETWLLADSQTVSKILGVDLEQWENLEDLNDTKDILEQAIAQSTYLNEDSSNQRPLQIRWKLAEEIDLAVIKTCCPNGYAAFTASLVITVRIVTKLNS